MPRPERERKSNVENTETGARPAVNSGGYAGRIRFHGGDIYEAAKRYGFDRDRIVDFSSNGNPLGPSPAAKRAAQKALSLIDRYPDPETTSLRTAIARYFGIKPEHVVCGNGSAGLIHLVPRVFRPNKILVPVPTFTEYAAAGESAGCEVVSLPLKERDGFRIDPIEMAFALKGAGMAFLCNPNDPTGELIPKTVMLEIAQYALQEGVKLVVDESFMDFTESESVVKEAVQSSNLVCIRSFSPFFGMPGLRIGYAVSNESTIAAIRAGQEPWSASIPAEHAAIAALNDWRHSKKTRKMIEKERNRLLSELRVLPDVETFPCTANFILVKLTSYDARMLTDKLGKQGMLLRDCSSFPGLGNGYIRISVRRKRENIRLVRAMRALLVRK